VTTPVYFLPDLLVDSAIPEGVASTYRMHRVSPDPF